MTMMNKLNLITYVACNKVSMDALNVCRIFLILNNILCAICKSECPVTMIAFSERSVHLNCDTSNGFEYHCMLNRHRRFVEFCGKPRILTTEGRCPKYTGESKYEYFQCRSSGCPNSSIKSTDLFLYPACLEPASHSESERDDKNLIAEETIVVGKIGDPLLVDVINVTFKNSSTVNMMPGMDERKETNTGNKKDNIILITITVVAFTAIVIVIYGGILKWAVNKVKHNRKMLEIRCEDQREENEPIYDIVVEHYV